MSDDEFLDSEVIEMAADYIEQHGWNKHGYCDDETDTKACGWGALYAVLGGSPRPSTACVAPSQVYRCESHLSEAVTGLYTKPKGALHDGHFPTWQDMDGRTKDEVLTLMRNVVADLKTRGL